MTGQISDWDYIDDSVAIILIIAATEKNIPVIYNRIYDILNEKRVIKVITPFGEPVDRKFAEIQYFRNNQKKMIDTWENLRKYISLRSS